MVLVADDRGVRMAKDAVEEEEVVAEHDRKPTRDQHQVHGSLVHHLHRLAVT